MSMRKLVVEMVDAHNLMPKDVQGSASPFVEVDIDQRFRTHAKQRDLNPVWNEKLGFNITYSTTLHNLSVEVYYIEEKGGGPGNGEKKGEKKGEDAKKTFDENKERKQKQPQQTAQQHGKVVEEKKGEEKPVSMHRPTLPVDYSLKETNPHLGGGGVNKDKLHDLNLSNQNLKYHACIYACV